MHNASDFAQEIQARSNVATEIVSLQTIFLHLTKACNLNCSYCYFSARKPLPDEMSTADFNRLWPEMAAVQPQKLVFNGGEPLIRADILELIRGLRDADVEHRVIRCLNSNGHLITPRLAEELVGLADEVRVSIDALAPRNDALRGIGNFEAAMKALETYRAVGFDPKVLVTVTRQSLPDLEELLCFLVERKFVSINVNRFRPVGRGALHADWSVSEAEIKLALERTRMRFRPEEASPPVSLEPESQCHCGVGRFLNVMPNGDVFPCHVLTQPEFRCGNLREQSLVEICRRQGLLGTLAGLDFRELVRADSALSQLTRPGVCMGEIYAKTQRSAAWRENIHQIQSQTEIGPLNQFKVNHEGLKGKF
jgi:MoaA/NifB/PqqE/SkfB family radical SAM enzyme